MATEKVLQTRIINKHAELTAWESSTLALKEGEIALAKVNVILPDGEEKATYVAKIGLEGKTFTESPMLYAPASDVYAWAKATTKPAYAAGEIATTTEGETVQSAITALKTAIGEGGDVSTQISTAIATALDALDLTEVTAGEGYIISTIKQENGKVTASARALTAADIPTIQISQVDGLQAALDAKADETSVAERFGDVSELIGTADDAATAETVYGAIAAVRATAEAARTETEVDGQIDAKIATFKTTVVDVIDGKVTDNAEAIADLAGEGRTTETVKGNADAIALLKEQIGDVANVMNFRGVSQSETVGADITDPKAGDVIIFGEAEYVYDESGAWVKFGDASDNATAISALDERVTTIETDLGTTGRVTKAIEAAQAKADQGVADAAQVATDLAAEIARATKAESDNLATAKAYAEEKASAAETAAKSHATQLDTATNEKIDAHIADTENPHSVTKAQVGLGEVDNKSVATIKTEFTGSVAADSDGFVTGAAAHAAIEAAKVAAGEATDGKLAPIKATYTRVEGDQLVFGQGEDVQYIVFDCGGAE